ncbi:hypothetical protein KAX17_09160 [Candidatus Bipolaricaulota bacterium]|nr:hypothetical protein [Candidatus Bipolaricaulota bacterium]
MFTSLGKISFQPVFTCQGRSEIPRIKTRPQRLGHQRPNGLICQYFPKQRELTTVAREEIEHAINRLNHQPKKTLGFRTPYEVFFFTKTPLTLALGS